jgi:hypothetical protein
MKLVYNNLVAEVWKVSDCANPVWEYRIYKDGKDITNTQYNQHQSPTMKWCKVQAKDALGIKRTSTDWDSLKWSTK